VGGLRTAAFSGDGTRVVTASSDDTARIWDAESGKEIAVLKGHDRQVSSAAFSGDGKRVVTASWDGTVRIWDAESGNMHNKLAALVALGKYLGMFDERPQNTNVIYAISDEPMSAEEWKKQYVRDR